MEATIMKNVSLKSLNTLRLDAVAGLMVYPHSQEALVEVMHHYEDKKVYVIGRGSNTLFKQRYYTDDILFLNLKMLDNIEQTGNELTIEAGVKLSDLAWFGVENNLIGYEYLEDIPGTIGGAILMNAGTYRNYIGDLVNSVTYYDIDKKEIITRKKQENDFGRRQSYWSNKNVILLSCTLKTENGDYLKALEEVQRIKKERVMKQPRNYPSAGSVFVRPNVDLKGKVVWQLLEEVGLRGFRHGGAAFSEKHPGFIINIENATFEDIDYLIKLAQERVKEQFDIELRVEWKMI